MYPNIRIIHDTVVGRGQPMIAVTRQESILIVEVYDGGLSRSQVSSSA